jgi:cytochrome c oxidase assembly protein subunit 15
VLTVSFGSAVAMWAVGYLSRLPGVGLPSPVLLLLLLACLFGGGWVLGRYGNLGWRYGAAAGLSTGLINLLVLGSFLSGARPDRIVPSALLWLPGSILLAVILSATGTAIGARWFPRNPPYPDWLAAFVKVSIAASMLLLVVGGLVTSTDAGLAVVDWPNSFGYNMFLYPFSRMTGGIYYEHAHRLFGALVGLTTVVLAVQLQLREPRRWVRGLGWAAVVMVVVQGVMGGLRVTGGFTLSGSPLAMRPNLVLAMIHGVFGQVFFATLVALGAFTSTVWNQPPARLRRPSARVDHWLSALLVLLVFGQLILGAAQRHLSALLIPHIVFGIAVVAPVAIHVGFRAWGMNEGLKLLQRLGLVLVAAVALQVLLGFGAFVAVRAAETGNLHPAAEVLATTAHQGFGAVLLATAVTLLCLNFRLIEAGEEPR